MTRKEQELVSYGIALFSIYMRAPNLTELDCVWCDNHTAALYAFRGEEFLAAAEFELESRDRGT